MRGLSPVLSSYGGGLMVGLMGAQAPFVLSERMPVGAAQPEVLKTPFHLRFSVPL
jgi:hypothetical protein